MEKLLNWFHEKDNLHIIEKAAIFHYRFVAIHPFDDGNGRLARLLMNLILIKAGYPPCVIKNYYRRRYLEALEIADKKKDYTDFIAFIAYNLYEIMSIIYEVSAGKNRLEILDDLFSEAANIHNAGKTKEVIGIYKGIIPAIKEDGKYFSKIIREGKILNLLKNKFLSVNEIHQFIPDIKRPTLKKDLQRLVKTKKIKKQGIKKGTIYFVK